MGGKIDDKFVDQSVDRFIQGRFQGDRDKFLQQLAKQGITLNQFRDIQRDQIAVQALRSKHTERNMGTGMLSLPGERKEIYDEIKHEYASEGKLKLRMLSVPKMTPEKGIPEQEAWIKSIRSEIIEGQKLRGDGEGAFPRQLSGKGRPGRDNRPIHSQSKTYPNSLQPASRSGVRGASTRRRSGSTARSRSTTSTRSSGRRSSTRTTTRSPGYVFDLIGRAAEPGDEVRTDGLRFTVLDVEGSRIQRLEVEFLPARRAGDEEGEAA